VIIECQGGDGDSSGLVSIRNAIPKIKPPVLGKLPMVPIIDLECSTNMNEEVF